MIGISFRVGKQSLVVATCRVSLLMIKRSELVCCMNVTHFCFLAHVINFSFNFQDIRNMLPSLLENIFGFGSEPGWGLDILSKSQNPHEYGAVLHLLAPEGTLLNLIYSLQTDIYLTYEFPFTCLPVSLWL